MIKPLPFHDELSLVEAAESLAKQAVQLELIPSFVLRYFADSSQFYIPDEQQEALTPERAYVQLKRLIDQATP